MCITHGCVVFEPSLQLFPLCTSSIRHSPLKGVIKESSDAEWHGEHAAQIGREAGRERAINVFSWEAVAAQTVRVYEQAIVRC